jgi:hypothetical protein
LFGDEGFTVDADGTSPTSPDSGNSVEDAGPPIVTGDAGQVDDANTMSDVVSPCDTTVDGAPCLPSASACMVGGNVLWIETTGNTRIYNGTTRVEGGHPWMATSQSYESPNDVVVVTAPPTGPAGVAWRIVFMLDGLHRSLQTGVVYAPTANTYDMNAIAVPLFDVDFLTGCDPYLGAVGAFELDEFQVTGEAADNVLDSITAAFSLHCNGYPGTLYGCVHYSQ